MTILVLELAAAAVILVVIGAVALLDRRADRRRSRKLRLERDLAARYGRGIGDTPRDGYSGDGC